MNLEDYFKRLQHLAKQHKAQSKGGTKPHLNKEDCS